MIYARGLRYIRYIEGQNVIVVERARMDETVRIGRSIRSAGARAHGGCRSSTDALESLICPSYLCPRSPVIFASATSASTVNPIIRVLSSYKSRSCGFLRLSDDLLI